MTCDFCGTCSPSDPLGLELIDAENSPYDGKMWFHWYILGPAFYWLRYSVQGAGKDLHTYIPLALEYKISQSTKDFSEINAKSEAIFRNLYNF